MLYQHEYSNKYDANLTTLVGTNISKNNACLHWKHKMKCPVCHKRKYGT